MVEFFRLSIKRRCCDYRRTTCSWAIQSKKVHFVIIAEDTGANTFKKVTDKCKFYGVEWVQKAGSDELGHALGKDFRKVVGITDPNFAKALKNKINA